MCELGQRLKQARESQGWELTGVAEQLKVRRVILEALEDCRFEALPEPALARGYLKRYAQLLGLDPVPLLALYPGKIPEFNPVTLETLSPKTPGPSPQPRKERTSSTAWWWIIPLVLLLAVGTWLLIRSLGAPRASTPAPTASVPVTPPPPQQISLRVVTQPGGARVYLDGFLLGSAPVETRVETGERTIRIEAQGFQTYEQVITLKQNKNLSVALTPVVAATPTPPSATPTTPTTPPAVTNDPNAPTPTPTVPTAGLALRMDGKSWIRVINARTGQRIYEGIPAQGTQLSYPLPVIVRAGNAGAVRVFVNGQDRGLMGEVGKVSVQRYGQ